MSANWQRLIRFVAVETSRIHIGQPVDPKIDVGLAVLSSKPLKAYEISGSALDPDAKVTSTVLTVKHLLDPLSKDQVKLVRCLGLNYRDHAAEAKLPLPETPVLFYKPASSLIGPNVPIVIPRVAQPVAEHVPDYEAELTIVIGKPAKDVSEANALDYVLGYVSGNDMSFRKHQMATSQWGFGKGFDNSTPFGPCIVSSRVISDPQNLAITTEVNGQLLQNGTTAEQVFSVRKTVAFLSQGTTLEPGSLIMTGTPKGVGFARKPQVYLKHGDEVRVFIGGGLGTLVNPVIEESKPKL
ncbi:hypothetical protein SISNIDRAFT_546874 [Sistotremastrum niveocremeum HHB9708]|uniref:Fumarylacetoacetase-like C-terminal domain-containing protein n=2 Tax=Sistotremastraceae TaxID=3402574 RepID=A0A164ZL52_9AGAM|nr:hypothetical protein SISNIDRAFT_546874 [Sistotremastrum niveocremeum HHB9708]KZT42953.1 hypothetical protein SISSUDRAFT_1125199 [Sistotremastrum suecicum HHB10207 ss-3]